jgi:hypothetical protein
MQRRIPLHPIHGVDFHALLVEEDVKTLVRAAEGGYVEGCVAEGVAGCVDKRADLFGGFLRGEDFAEEVDIVLAARGEEYLFCEPGQ